MSRSARSTATGSSLKLDVVIASLLLNGGILVALFTWLTADRGPLVAWISTEPFRSIAAALVIGAPVAIATSIASRLSARLPADLGTGTLLALIAGLSTVFTTALVVISALGWESLASDPSVLTRLLFALINCTTVFLVARVVARRARQHPDWISIISTIFAVGLLPLALLSIVFDPFTVRNVFAVGPFPQGFANVAIAAIYLVAVLPALFFGRLLLRTEAARYRPVERLFVDVLAAFGVGSLAATVVPLATTRLYDTLQNCTNEYVCTRPPGEWVVIGLLTGLAAWRLIRGAEGAKQPLLWIGALPPVITTAIAINWYLPAELGGLPVAGALIALGGLVLLRRATMTPAPRLRRAAKRR
jgi:hypothetical protein